jgi:hypothetical protein
VNGTIWEEKVVACVMLLSHRFPGGTEDNFSQDS